VKSSKTRSSLLNFYSAIYITHSRNINKSTQKILIGMKNILYLFIFSLFIALALVNAGEIKKIDLEGKETVIVTTKVKDAVEFYMFTGRHIVTVDEITKKGIDLDIFLFVNEEQKLTYVTVNKEHTVKLDFDKDNKGDLYIAYGGYVNDKTAKLIFTKLGPTGEEIVDKENPVPDDQAISGITGAITKENPVRQSPVTWILLLILTSLAVITISLVIYKKQQNRLKKIKNPPYESSHKQ